MTEPTRDDRLDDVGFPADLDDLTADVLGAALATRVPGVGVDRIDIVSTKRAGAGMASTADRVVIDVTYAEVRRTHQRDLLAEHLDRLAAAGLRTAPTLEDAFVQYRAAALWGLVIGWLICPPENYGREITVANIARTVAAVKDLDTFATIATASPR